MGKRNTPSLIDVAKDFGTDEQCIAYLEAMRWPKGVRCVKCDSDKISKFTVAASETTRKNRKTGVIRVVKVPARYLYQCLDAECKQQFSATANTIFHDSHLPLSTWFMATALIVNAKKGLSAKQLERDINVSYPTAWYLYHRIREAMNDGSGDPFTGTVEVDCTFVGGKFDKRRKRQRWDKPAVAGVMQRGIDETGPSQVRTFHVSGENRKAMLPVIEQHIAKDAQVYTDDARVYMTLGQARAHEVVNHTGGEYVRGTVHTNTVEGFWSLFKRGLIGQYHFISIKHLGRYLNEFQFRFNNREAEDLFMLVLLNLVAGSPLPRAVLMANGSVVKTETDGQPF